jgi:hypothetical protein
LFDKILLPLSSEYYPELAVKRALDIAYKFKSELTLEYIFEKKVIDKINDVSSGAVTQCSLEEMAEDVKNVEVASESTVIFEEIENMARGKGIQIHKQIHSGYLSDEIIDCITGHGINLIITEFHRDALSKYRILYDSPIPVWLENNGKKVESIHGILTNLSPNTLVPNAAFYLSKKLDLPLHFYYVLDSTDSQNGKTDWSEQKQLIRNLRARAKKLNIYFEYDTITEDISHFLSNNYRHKETSVVILGRFKKPVKMPFDSRDKKIEVSKKLDANVLMLK